jgi:hypothetical protein
MKYPMADGRAFTSYAPNCTLNETIKQENGIANDTEYRYFLQHSVDIIKKQMSSPQSPDCVFCPVCKEALDLGNGQPPVKL